MKTFALAAALLASLAATTPAHAGPGAGGFTCGMTAYAGPDSSYQGTVVGGPVHSSPITITCSVVVSGVVRASVSASGQGTTTLGPAPVRFYADPTDEVSLCTTWSLDGYGTVYWNGADPAAVRSGYWDTNPGNCAPVTSVGSGAMLFRAPEPATVGDPTAG
jgi:hypothetical protein